MKKTVAPRHTRKVGIEVHGDFEQACSGGSVTMHGSAGGGCFVVRYFGTGADGFHSTVENTASFVGAGFDTDVAPGFDRAFRLEVKAKGCAVPGSKRTVNIDTAPTKEGQGIDFDRVRAKLIVE